MSVISNNHFNSVPSEIVHEIALQLPPKDLYTFIVACKRFKQIFENYNLWNKLYSYAFERCLVFNPIFTQAIDFLSREVLNTNNTNNTYTVTLNKKKKPDKKFLKIISNKLGISFNTLKKIENDLTIAESNLEQAQLQITDAAKKLAITFQGCLSDLKLSPSGIMDGFYWTKLQDCFVSLREWLCKVVGIEGNIQQSFIREKFESIYSSILQSTYSWMINELVNSKEPFTETRYKILVGCLRGDDKLLSDLNIKLKAKHGVDCLKFNETF